MHKHPPLYTSNNPSPCFLLQPPFWPQQTWHQIVQSWPKGVQSPKRMILLQNSFLLDMPLSDWWKMDGTGCRDFWTFKKNLLKQKGRYLEILLMDEFLYQVRLSHRGIAWNILTGAQTGPKTSMVYPHLSCIKSMESEMCFLTSKKYCTWELSEQNQQNSETNFAKGSIFAAKPTCWQIASVSFPLQSPPNLEVEAKGSVSLQQPCRNPQVKQKGVPSLKLKRMVGRRSFPFGMAQPGRFKLFVSGRVYIYLYYLRSRWHGCHNPMSSTVTGPVLPYPFWPVQTILTLEWIWKKRAFGRYVRIDSLHCVVYIPRWNMKWKDFNLSAMWAAFKAILTLHPLQIPECR